MEVNQDRGFWGNVFPSRLRIFGMSLIGISFVVALLLSAFLGLQAFNIIQPFSMTASVVVYGIGFSLCLLITGIGFIIAIVDMVRQARRKQRNGVGGI